MGLLGVPEVMQVALGTDSSSECQAGWGGRGGSQTTVGLKVDTALGPGRGEIKGGSLFG